MARTVNPERRAQKKREIVKAATECFAEKGFHSTSMQDVCRMAGMSPGALYRYFSSKEDIIIAIIEEEQRLNEEFSLEVSQSGNLLGSVTEAIDYVIEQNKKPGYAKMSAEVYAEILRNEAAKELAKDSHSKVHTVLTDVIQQSVEKGEVDDSWDVEALSEVLLMMIDAVDTRPPFCKSVSEKAFRDTVVKLINTIGQK